MDSEKHHVETPQKKYLYIVKCMVQTLVYESWRGLKRAPYSLDGKV